MDNQVFQEPHSWIIWSPDADSPTDVNVRHVAGLSAVAQSVRLMYRVIVVSGLRNPDTGFNPADYLGYMLPTTIPSDLDKDPANKGIQALTFGLLHIDRKKDFFPDSIKFKPAEVDGYELRKASLRWIGYDMENLVAAEKFPFKLRYYKSWEGHTRLVTGTMPIPAPHIYIHRTLNHLLNPPGFSEEKVEQAATDLLNRLRTGESDGTGT